MDWERVEKVFAEVADLPPAERDAYLDAAELADEDRAEVERLLGHHDKSGPFLDSPVLPRPPDTERLPEGWESTTPVAEVGRMLGPYKLTRLIGEGGMGAVYLATRDDDEFSREVAVKLIRHRHDSEALIRFRSERQILAGLEHQNIARLYDGGTDDGRPFLVMEYVEGVRIDTYCRKADLGIEARLRLFQQVCAAVEHAHRALLVHRDLKPANILVDGEGVPKLLDFGIAKSLEEGSDTGATRAGRHPMTPAYASPEQVRGKLVTTASDVYSLGVVLYELLTGKSPYQLSDESDVTLQVAIRDQDPVKPSSAVRSVETTGTLTRELRGDLDTIVLKALRKEPEHRYASVGALAEDIGRYLAHLPVHARRAGMSYRLRKFVRRNRLAVAAGAVVAVVLFGFLVALIRQTRVANRQRDRAELTLSAFADAFSASDPELAQGREITAREMLDQGADRVRQSLAAEPDSLATLLATMGRVYTSLGIFDKADTLHREAHELRRGGDAEALSFFERGELEWWRRDYRAAEEFYRQALDVTADDPVQFARIQRGLGLALVRQGRHDDGEVLLNDALTALGGHFDDTHPEILRCLDGLALAAENRADYAAAADLYRQVIAARRKLGSGPSLGRSLAGLGTALQLQGQLEEAENLFGEALPLLQEVMGGSENVYVAEALGELLTLRLELDAEARDSHVETEGLLRDILDMRGSVIPASHPTIVDALHNLAPILARRGELNEARTVAEQALQVSRDLYGETHEMVAGSLCGLGMIAKAGGENNTAKTHFDACAAVLKQMHPGGHPQLAFPWFALGEIAKSEQGCAAAEPWFRRAFNIRREHLGADHFMTQRTGAALAECQRR